MITIQSSILFRRLLATALLAVTGALLLAGPSSAQILVETFDYPSGTDLATTATWDLARSDSGPLVTTSGDEVYPNYNLSGGNRVAMTPGSAAVSHTFTAVTSGAVYFAFLVNFSAATTQANGGLFFWGGTDDSIFSRELSLAANEDGSGNLRFRLAKSSAFAATGYDYALNSTHLLVAKYDIVAGADNDVVSLYVNPDLTTGLEPAVAQVTTSSGTDAVDGSSNPLFASVVISGVDQSTAPPTGTLDNLRISTTWETSALPVQLMGFEVE